MKKNFVEKEAFAKPSSQSYNYKQVQSIFPARLIYVGEVTGTRYEWPAAGTVLSVNSLDVPDLLTKRVGKNSCCGGGQNENKSFQLVE
jgi:hypothetical protein